LKIILKERKLKTILIFLWPIHTFISDSARLGLAGSLDSGKGLSRKLHKFWVMP